MMQAKTLIQALDALDKNGRDILEGYLEEAFEVDVQEDDDEWLSYDKAARAARALIDYMVGKPGEVISGTIQLRPFTKHDWDAFSGCQTSEPLIDEDVTVDSEEAVLIVDGTEIHFYPNDGVGYWRLTSPEPQVLLGLLPSRLVSSRVLKALGFQRR